MIRNMLPKPPTSLEYALLGLLHQQPRSGYDLRKVMATTALGTYSTSPGAIYPALRRLEEGGLIRGEIDDSTPMRPRKVFAPSDAGSAIFRDWLRAAISADDVARRLDELMLKFAFHWVLDDAQASRAFLLDLAREIGLYVRELKSQLLLLAPETPIQSRLALEAGMEQCRAAARWARNALEHFEDSSGGGTPAR